MRVRRCVERIDSYVPSPRRSMNESIGVDCDSHMELLTRQMHENKIAGLQLRARDRRTGTQLLQHRPWQTNSRVIGGVHDEAAAVETAGGGAAVSIRLAEHGRCAVDDLGLRKAGVTFASGVVGRTAFSAGAVVQAARARATPAMTAVVLMHAAPSWSMREQRSRQGGADDARLRAQRPDAQKRFTVQLIHEFFRLFGDTAA